MESRFFKCRFSKHFNDLTKCGIWPIEFTNPFKRYLFTVYRIIVACFLLLVIALQTGDLVLVMGNLRKVSFNLSTSVIVSGTFLKLLFILPNKKYVNQLRWNLWRDSFKYDDEQDVAFKDFAYNELLYIRKWFYTAASVVLPAWLIISYFSYLWGPREFPFPAYFPFDDSNEATYLPFFIFEAFCGAFCIRIVMDTDLSMYSIIVQITAQHRILAKNILKLNQMYEDEEFRETKIVEHFHNQKILDKRDVIAYLRKDRTKKLLKAFIIRQTELIGYLKTFELCYNKCLFVQIFAGSLLIIMNGFQLTLLNGEVSIKLCYQVGYLALIMLDMLFICYHFTQADKECRDIGNAFYATVWYKMEPNFQKIVSMAIMVSQRPPKITCGKLLTLNLNFYLSMMKNVYSWLMLFRQLEMK